MKSMKLIDILVIGALARSVECGGSEAVNICNKRSALWINQLFCAETFTDESKYSQAQILSAPSYELFEVFPKEQDIEQFDSGKVVHDFTLPWEMTDDKAHTTMMEFMVWAALIRDMEMQTASDPGLCTRDPDLPWRVQMCMDDTTPVKKVHHSQPIISPIDEMNHGLPHEKGSILTPRSAQARNMPPLLTPSIGDSRINLSFVADDDKIAVDVKR